MSTRVKICGLMNVNDVHMCLRYGVDVLGFVVNYPHPVPWNIDAQTAMGLISELTKNSGVYHSCSETCIVTGGGSENVLETALTVKPDFVQLHTRESVEETAFLVSALREHGIEVIKSIYPDTEDEEVIGLSNAEVYALLFDSRVPEKAHTSSSANLTRFIELKEITKCPLILAGGLDAANIASAIQTAKPWMVDIMTGIESSYGVKDEAKLKALMGAIG